MYGREGTRMVVAVVVHYGDPRRTIRAVLTYHNLGVFSDIIVVANDLSQQPAELNEISCTWVIPDRNLGFGAACQLGAMTRLADVYAFFNAHVTIDRASVESCVSAFDIEDVGIAAPYIYHPSTGIPAVDWNYVHGVRTYSPVLRLPIVVPRSESYPKDRINRPKLIDNEWATGGTVFCRDEVVRDVGWDGSYFLIYEDVDISMRAKRCGWRIVTVPPAIAVHSGESTRTSRASAYYSTRNSIWFARKYRTRRVRALLIAYLLLMLCRVAAADVIKRRQQPRARPAARGILDGLLLWPTNIEALSGEPLWSSES
jgi:GT2 family glycosyltransferase